jgi:hypothetical protein
MELDQLLMPSCLIVELIYAIQVRPALKGKCEVRSWRSRVLLLPLLRAMASGQRVHTLTGNACLSGLRAQPEMQKTNNAA